MLIPHGLTLEFATSDPSKATIKDGFVYVHGHRLVTISAIQKVIEGLNPLNLLIKTSQSDMVIYSQILHPV